LTIATKLPVQENVSTSGYNKITKPYSQSFFKLNKSLYFNTKYNNLVTKSAYFTTLKTKFTTLEAKFTTLEAKFATLEAKFTTLEAKFKTLETKFTTLEGKSKTLEGKFKTLERKFTTLEGKFTTMLTLLINNLNYDENKGFYFCNNLKYNSYKQNNSILYINK